MRFQILRVFFTVTREQPRKKKKKMPCLNISTNVNLEGVDTSSVLSEATSTVAKLIGKPEAVCCTSPSCFVLYFELVQVIMFQLFVFSFWVEFLVFGQLPRCSIVFVSLCGSWVLILLRVYRK